MSRTRTFKSMSILALVVGLTFSLTGCFGSGGNDKEEGPYSGISVNAIYDSDSLIPAQEVVIKLGEQPTWRLKVSVDRSKQDDIHAEVAASKIVDTVHAKQLDLSPGARKDSECYTCSGNTTENFIVTLVEGEYYVVINGRPTDVVIKVIK